MIKFNDILRLEGIDPRDVRLVRHQDRRARTPSLYDVWRSNPTKLERYQAIQSRPVFTVGDLLASFVVTPKPQRATLFIGLYVVSAAGRAPEGARDPILGHHVGGLHKFKIRPVEKLAEYVGRLTIDWGRGYIAWVQRANQHDKYVVAIQTEVDPPFPGFEEFAWDIASINDMPPDWKEHLGHVKGVYLLVDKETGMRYVGSAVGEESLWGRFQDYFKTGHGGNVELRRLGRRPYRASVLQIGSFDGDILKYEQAWKQKLMTIDFGLNRN